MSEVTFEAAAIYVDLDALFDTRLATLFQIRPELAESVLASNYFHRVHDEFEGVESTVFQEAYQKRDTATLKQAILTPVSRLINTFIRDTLLALMNSPYRRQPKVVVNLYPYQLSPESEAVLIEGLISMTGKMADIELIRVPYDEISPQYVKANYVQMVMYNYWDWLESQAVNKNWVDHQCPEVALFGPQLVKSKEAAKTLEGQPVFSSFEAGVGLFVKLVLLPVQMFCADLDRYAKTQRI